MRLIKSSTTGELSKFLSRELDPAICDPGVSQCKLGGMWQCDNYIEVIAQDLYGILVKFPGPITHLEARNFQYNMREISDLELFCLH